MNRRKADKQTGFSLVEMMVALVIGLFVLAGVGSVYITGKRTYKARDGLSILQENGRVAIKLIEQGVSRAGYPTYALVEPVIHNEGQLDRLKLATDSKKTAASLGIKRSSDGDKGSSDTLTVAYIPIKDGAYEEGLDCIGNKSSLGNRVVSSYYVENDVLKCRGSGKSSGEPVAENVKALQVEYGEDLTDDGFADRYLSFSDVSAWDKVVSIRIALLVSSGTDVLEKPPENAREFFLLGEKISIPIDKKVYRVFGATIPLRNKIPIL